MSTLIAWMAAEAERPEMGASPGFPRRTRRSEEQTQRMQHLPTHRIERADSAGYARGNRRTGFVPAAVAGGGRSGTGTANLPGKDGRDVAALHALLD